MTVTTAEAHRLPALLQRSDAFEGAIRACFPDAGLPTGGADRLRSLTAAACVLSVEHARVLRTAFSLSAPQSGAALLRLQFEALLRAAWLMFGAIPPQVDLLHGTADLEAEQAAGHLPRPAAMLEAVVKLAPLGMAAPLAEFDRSSRQVPGAIAQHRPGQAPPPELLTTTLRLSNAMLHFAYRLLAGFGDSEERMDQVTELYLRFGDCVPMPR